LNSDVSWLDPVQLKNERLALISEGRASKRIELSLKRPFFAASAVLEREFITSELWQIKGRAEVTVPIKKEWHYETSSRGHLTGLKLFSEHIEKNRSPSRIYSAKYVGPMLVLQNVDPSAEGTASSTLAALELPIFCSSDLFFALEEVEVIWADSTQARRFFVLGGGKLFATSLINSSNDEMRGRLLEVKPSDISGDLEKLFEAHENKKASEFAISRWSDTKKLRSLEFKVPLLGIQTVDFSSN
jgi:hypothetical protein